MKSIDERMEMFKAYLDRSNMDHKTYQYDGVRWALENELRADPPCKVRGGFIADEMGLGKTIMMIGLMYCHFVRCTLIVVPPVLVDQWYSQIYRTTGHKALIYYGSKKKTTTLADLAAAPIVITTYGAITHKNLDASLLHKVKWSRIIFDEAHHLRNSGTARYLCARALVSNCRFRWLVSGTPVQNKKRDFYSLCELLGMTRSYYSNNANIADIRRSFILKRTKKQVGIELEEIQNKQTCVEWRNYNEMMMAQVLHSLINKSSDSSDSSARLLGHLRLQEFLTNKLQLMLRARQVCIYPKMILAYLENKFGIKDLMGDCSSKLDAVVQSILLRKDNGCGKLIFCHFRKEIDEIRRRLMEGGMTKVAAFDGRLSGSKKMRRIMLQEKHDALILQIQTGCEGLNLQENYSEIYFVSPHWNPAIEDQAVARCHRIGQTKKVYVERFGMSSFGSGECVVENYIKDVQEQKRELANTMICN